MALRPVGSLARVLWDNVIEPGRKYSDTPWAFHPRPDAKPNESGVRIITAVHERAPVLVGNEYGRSRILIAAKDDYDSVILPSKHSGWVVDVPRDSQRSIGPFAMVWSEFVDAIRIYSKMAQVGLDDPRPDTEVTRDIWVSRMFRRQYTGDPNGRVVVTPWAPQPHGDMQSWSGQLYQFILSDPETREYLRYGWPQFLFQDDAQAPWADAQIGQEAPDEWWG